jgi:hypothetical protein
MLVCGSELLLMKVAKNLITILAMIGFRSTFIVWWVGKQSMFLCFIIYQETS